MNTYTVQFFVFCPNNNIRVMHTLVLKVDRVVMVEDLIDAVTLHTRGFHEDIADQLCREFGGTQTMTAHHHGVDIQTVRTAEFLRMAA